MSTLQIGMFADVKPFTPMSIELRGVILDQCEDNSQEAELTFGANTVRLTNAQLHELFWKLDMFMTNMNYQKNGWKRPYLKVED